METILVTGGAGFIGGEFVRRAVDDGGRRVINLDKLTYAGNLDSLASVMTNPRHEFIEGDICNPWSVDEIIREYQPQTIVHFAAETHVDRSISGPAAFVQTNIIGTFTLLQAVRAYWKHLPDCERDRFRFLHVSTDEVYGSLGATGRFTEETPYDPSSPYAATKAAADHLVRASHHTYGLPTLITHCSNNYGPYQFPEKLIPLMILNAVEGKPLPVYGDGQHVRDWLFVGDHCEAIDAALERGTPGETYNVGGDAEHTNLEVVETICDLIDELVPDLPHRPCRSLIRFVEDRPGHDFRYAIDASKIGRALGWQPRHDFAAGLRETVVWYLDHEEWVERVASGTYQRERLGLDTPVVGAGF